jgi:ribonuclease HII
MLLQNYANKALEAGTDEAGRGCLAGPVTAAAVILSPTLSKGEGEKSPSILPKGKAFSPSNLTKGKAFENNSIENYFSLLNDSKLLSEKNREILRPIIEETAIAFAVTNIEPAIIDEINILNASLKAMQECILKLKPLPIYIIVDGNRPLIAKKKMIYTSGKIFTDAEIETLNSIPSTSIIKGDSKYLSIAAASVLAKTYRDEYMNKIHEEFPMYNWKQNKGYPTKEHREAIKKYGVTKYHRMTFRLI